jgi:hypothetical protein
MDNNIRNNSGGVINPSMMNGNSNNSISPESKKVNNKNAKVTLDKNGKPKRKKASRACQSCQKAHLTCDDARPCQRCIKRGLQESCQDGIRKKAKYLQDAIDVADQKPAEQISPTMPPPNMAGSTTINPSFVQNTGPQMKYESQHYFKGSIPRRRTLVNIY